LVAINERRHDEIVDGDGDNDGDGDGDDDDDYAP